MNDADNTQEQNGTTQEGPHESTQEEQDKVPTAAKTKRNPRQPKAPKRPKDTKTNKVIAEAVGHTEYSDDQKPRTPLPDNEPSLLDMINETTPPELIGQPEAKAKSKEKANIRGLYACTNDQLRQALKRGVCVLRFTTLRLHSLNQ